MFLFQYICSRTVNEQRTRIHSIASTTQRALSLVSPTKACLCYLPNGYQQWSNWTTKNVQTYGDKACTFLRDWRENWGKNKHELYKLYCWWLNEAYWDWKNAPTHACLRCLFLSLFASKQCSSRAEFRKFKHCVYPQLEPKRTFSHGEHTEKQLEMDTATAEGSKRSSSTQFSWLHPVNPNGIMTRVALGQGSTLAMPLKHGGRLSWN